MCPDGRIDERSARHRRDRPRRARDRGQARGRGLAGVSPPGRKDGDVARPEEARALVERAAAELGGLGLVVHAASDGFVPQAIEDVTEADWDAAFGATAKGAFFVSQAAAPFLRESKGLIVLIEDVAAFEPWPSFAPHSAAKAAEAMLTRVLARALAPDVRVCGVAPGSVADRRNGRPERAARGRVAARPDRNARRRRRRRPLPHARELRHRHEHRGGRRPPARPAQRRAAVAATKETLEPFHERWNTCGVRF